MPKFLKVGDYQPQDYTKADYMQYQYLGGSISKDALFRFHIEELESLTGHGTLYQPFEIDNINDYVANIKNEVRTMSHLGELLEKLKYDRFDACFREPFESKRKAFLDAAVLVNAVFGHVRAPDELSPTVKSKQNLMRAARLCRQLGSYDVTPTDVAQAHTANLALVNDSNFEQDCEAEFLHDGPIRVAFVAAVPDHPSTQTLRSPAPDNAGFFLKIYHHPAFQHWLTQVILAAVVLTAVGVVAAFMLNASMLPLAVAGVVKGLSSMVAKTVFGSALVIGTAATFTLAASLQARFFSEARDDAAPPAGAGLTPIVAHL